MTQKRNDEERARALASSGTSPAQQRMLRQVSSKQNRLERGRNRWTWSSISVLGVIGWSVSVPTLLGVALGVWIDHRWPSRFSWSLMLLLGGLLLGCVHAWLRIKGDQS